MVRQIEDEKFLNQIRTILKRHIEKEGANPSFSDCQAAVVLNFLAVLAILLSNPW